MAPQRRPVTSRPVASRRKSPRQTGLREFQKRAGAVGEAKAARRQAVLFLGAHFAEGALKAVRQEDRVVTEAGAPARRPDDGAGDLSREANELARVAAVGDIALVREQFGKLGRTCKACHYDFRDKDLMRPA